MHFLPPANKITKLANSIFTKGVTKKKLIVLNEKTALALSDPVRAKILLALTHRPMNAEEIAAALKPLGMDKATSTIRHHLDVLKGCNLVEVSRIDEVRGAVTKYYSPRAKLMEEQTSDDIELNAKLVDETCRKLAKLMAAAVKNLGLTETKEGLPACSLCSSSHARELSLITLLNYCTLRVLEDETFQKALAVPAAAPRDARPSRSKGS
jgi:DNA-binding transcriptional ArsR family regulator